MKTAAPDMADLEAEGPHFEARNASPRGGMRNETAVDHLPAVRWVPVLLYPSGSRRPLPHRFALKATAWEAARAAAAADLASAGFTVVRADPERAESADALLQSGALEGAGIGNWSGPPTSWAALVSGEGWQAILRTRDRQAGEAAMALPAGASAASMAGSDAWEVVEVQCRAMTTGAV
jgi:hypothetical protein